MSPEHPPILRPEEKADSPEALDEAVAAMLLAQAGQEPHDRELADWVSGIQENMSDANEGIRAAFLRITERISMEEYDLIRRQPMSALNEWRDALHVSRYRAHLANRLEEVRSDPLFWKIHAETQARQEQWLQIPIRKLGSSKDRAKLSATVRGMRNDSSMLDRQERTARLRATKIPFPLLSLEDALSGVKDEYDEGVYQEQLQAVAANRTQLVERIEQHMTTLKDVHPNDLFHAYVNNVLSPEERSLIHDASVQAIYRMEKVLGIPDCDHKFPRFREWADHDYPVEALRTEYMFDPLSRVFLPDKLPSALKGTEEIYRLIDQVVLIAICGLRTPGNRSRLDPALVIPRDPYAATSSR